MTLLVILFFSYLHFLHDPGAVSARPCAEQALKPAGLRPKPRGSTKVAGPGCTITTVGHKLRSRCQL